MLRYRLAVLLAVLVAAPVMADQHPDEIERVFTRLYNFDFQGAHRILDTYVSSNASDPIAYSVRAAVHLFYELDRLGILESEFFTDDRRLISKTGSKPDAHIRTRFYDALKEAQDRAASELGAKPGDPNALMAMCMAQGLLLDYVALVEKKHLGSLPHVKRSNGCAQRLLELHPQVHDAYVTTGFTEYLVGSLPFYVRWVVRFKDVKGSKEDAIRNLETAARSGRYLKPFAKILLAVIHLRERRPQESASLLAELARDYPENPLIRKELAKISARLSTDTLQVQ